MEQMVIFDRIPAVPRNRNSQNSVPNPSAEEKTTRNSVPWTKNRSKLSESLPEPLQRKRKQLGILFSGTEKEAKSRNSVPWN